MAEPELMSLTSHTYSDSLFFLQGTAAVVCAVGCLAE